MSKTISRTKGIAAKTLFAAMQILKEQGGSLSSKQVAEYVAQRISLDAWSLDRYDSGGIRWQVIMTFYSVDFMKAGFIVKKKGTWYLTPEGEAAMALGDVGMLEEANVAYRKWRRERDASAVAEPSETEESVEKEPTITLEQIEQLATEGLWKFIAAKNPYEFQDLAAALLRGMGYYTPFVAPPGKDGGVDIVAYRDPLGTVSPRMKVQVKHRATSANVQEIRQLMGILTKDGEVGVFISTSGFTPDAQITARSSHIHMELIDLPRFISLWQEFYHKLADEDKTLLPLRPVHFLEPGE